jgi:anti-sigma regulatory factor (Ser/Thr protein kinase)
VSGAHGDFSVRATVALAASPTSAAQARRFIRDFCTAADLGEDACEKASLLVSELVTNAVVHGRSRATLIAARPEGRLRVAVLDNDVRLPEGPQPANPDAEGGRGLRIVAAVADRWGVETTDEGKSVWFEIDLDGPASSAH